MSSHECDRSPRKRILLGVTASVAAIKTQLLLNLLINNDYDVEVVATDASLYFFDQNKIPVRIHKTADEMCCWKTRGDPLRNWADILLIAPLSANTLAKISNGIADNLLTCIARAWWWSNKQERKPAFFAPAMNTQMWEHPLTCEHIDVLVHKLHWTQIPPISKVLICGEHGIGAMEEPENIVSTIKTFFLN
ncbi:unnamed protein product [Protopolystoma xenopodis]|uniref:Flavoprotein domain-containing protein n=1 Tax=Protopolystoma xenopodis TaxID=117903 RepID=A0A3S5ASW9_9PLAT|nr:unnamed protein product [Protopolystoma xenopodis]